MSGQSAQQLLQQARDAQASAEGSAATARAAVEAMQGMAGSAGNAAHAATGGAVDPVVFQFAVFVLAILVGYYVVWQVTPALHTPLMSVTNAISSVVVVGALLSVGVQFAPEFGRGPILARAFGFFALVFASVNIFGGFLVTQRMLAMYKKKG